MIVIAGMLVDASLTESHQFTSEVTSYPVESGSDITDNVRVKPIEVDIEGIVSNTPLAQMKQLRKTRGEFNDPRTSNISATASPPFTSITNDVTPASSALAALLRIRDQREPVSITTALRVYDSMVLESLTIPMAADKTGALYFSAKFKQVIIVTNERTVVKTATPSTGGKGSGTGSAKYGDSIVYVVSYPTSQRGIYGFSHRLVITDTSPPRFPTVQSVTWDHWAINNVGDFSDGFCAIPTTIKGNDVNAKNFAGGPKLQYFATSSAVVYDKKAAGYVTPDGRKITRMTPGSVPPINATPGEANADWAKTVNNTSGVDANQAATRYKPEDTSKGGHFI